jgi:hypothetical protein
MEHGGAISLQTLVQSECESTFYRLTDRLSNDIILPVEQFFDKSKKMISVTLIIRGVTPQEVVIC